MSERLIPVTSEAQLKPGVLVEHRSCVLCGGSHRHLLLGRYVDRRLCAACFTSDCGWKIPATSHAVGDPYLCVRVSIPAGRLFIVDTGLEDAEPVRTARNRPKEAIR